MSQSCPWSGSERTGVFPPCSEPQGSRLPARGSLAPQKVTQCASCRGHLPFIYRAASTAALTPWGPDKGAMLFALLQHRQLPHIWCSRHLGGCQETGRESAVAVPAPDGAGRQVGGLSIPPRVLPQPAEPMPSSLLMNVAAREQWPSTPSEKERKGGISGSALLLGLRAHPL